VRYFFDSPIRLRLSYLILASAGAAATMVVEPGARSGEVHCETFEIGKQPVARKTARGAWA
jgi:hypothetical protein